MIAQTYQVLIAGTLAGYLTRNAKGSIAFRFVDAYRLLVNRPVLSQSFEDDLEKTYTGKGNALPPFFANLVPESSLRELLENSLQLPPGDDLALLSAVGQDLPGAVEILPGDESLNLVVTGSAEEGDGEELEGIEGDSVFRFSLAGVQLKFSILKEDERLTIPSHGELGDWIVKLDSLRFPQLTENEFATMEWARIAGFDVPECKLLPVNSLPIALRARAPQNSQIFLIQRYDRHAGQRIHQEDFAQALGMYPESKYKQITYEQCARIVLALCGLAGYYEFIRRLVFMVASGNADAHLKNWSFLYPDGYKAQLTPLYDQVAVITWPLEKGLAWEWALKFMGTRILNVIDETTFQRLADRIGMDAKETLRVVRETLLQIANAWHQSVAPDVMPAAHLNLLQKHWERVPLLKGYAHLISPRQDLFSD